MWIALFIFGIAAAVAGTRIFFELVTGAAFFGIPLAIAHGQFGTAVFCAGLLAYCLWRAGRFA